MEETDASGRAPDRRSREEHDRETGTRAEEWVMAAGTETSADSPAAYAEELLDLAVEDPVAAGDHVGDLVALAEAHDDAREPAGRALDVLGWRRPGEFEVWTDALTTLADAAEADLATMGMGALADLAAETPRAVAGAADVAVRALTAESPRLRQAALAVVAEVGGGSPDSVRGADRHVAAAIDDAVPEVRLAAAIAAGRLLPADPTAFPRTAVALLEATEDDHARVREYATVSLANFAREQPERVPDADRAATVLATRSDAELGLRRGATGEAVSALVGSGTGRQAQ
jgi:hypothetical protein